MGNIANWKGGDSISVNTDRICFLSDLKINLKKSNVYPRAYMINGSYNKVKSLQSKEYL